MTTLPLPAALEPYRAILEKTQKTYIAMTPKKEKGKVSQSKFGGIPYFPKEMDYPHDEHGVPMFLLAQINFEEVPNLELYPKTGILQFFVPFDDDAYGIDFDDLTHQQNFRVIYHPTILPIEELVGDFSFLQHPDEDKLPFSHEMTLSFQVKEEYISQSDFRFEQLLGEKIDLEEVVDGIELYEHYADHISSSGHKIGGYAYFTQMDVRDSSTYQNHKHLLFQMDSDDENDIMWGDVGVANFFIREEDLKKLNFDNVLYTWDCC